MVILFIYEKDFVPDLSSCKKNKIVYTIYNLHLLVPVGFWCFRMEARSLLMYTFYFMINFYMQWHIELGT